MIDYSQRGARVRIKHPLRTHYRHFSGQETGTIVSAVETNVGQTLFEIEWDGIGQSPVFPHEVIFLDDIQASS